MANFGAPYAGGLFRKLIDQQANAAPPVDPNSMANVGLMPMQAQAAQTSWSPPALTTMPMGGTMPAPPPVEQAAFKPDAGMVNFGAQLMKDSQPQFAPMQAPTPQQIYGQFRGPGRFTPFFDSQQSGGSPRAFGWGRRS